jgi:hypothetical protein
LYAGMMGTLLVSIVSAISEALQSEGVRPEVICSCPPGHSKSS